MRIFVVFLIIGMLIWCRMMYVRREMFTGNDEIEINNMKKDIGETKADVGEIKGSIRTIDSSIRTIDSNNKIINDNFVRIENNASNDKNELYHRIEINENETNNTKQIQNNMNMRLDDFELLTAFNTYGLIPLMSYYKVDEDGVPMLDDDGYPILEFPKGDAGERGLQGAKGDTGERGLQGASGGKGDKGDKGDVGRDGASVFDVSKYLLNGNTDLFKRKEDRKDRGEPQPINAYTTLFD